ncbi:MAG TPA: hypothetical protein VD997_07815 [Phycisphaerales bacterium]|nr:hypothetical protein [Phycisphaerales bacterium]
MRSSFNARTMLVAAAGLLSAATANAALITDASFFTPYPTTLINFETDVLGNPITLLQGQRLTMPANAYSPLGVTFAGKGSEPVYWVNDGNAAFDAAQTLGGSPNVSIPSSLTNSFTVTFSVPVQALGFFVVNNRIADPTGPVFVARDAQGNVLETATWGSMFIDNTISIPNTTADYGFMGITTSTPIASVTVTKVHAILDDFRFSPIPAPGTVSLAAVGAALIASRRRRRS